MRKLALILSLTSLLFACTDSAETSEVENEQADSTSIVTKEAFNEVNESTESTPEQFEKEAVEPENQMTFCDCVRKLKELENKMIESETDEEFSALEKEMDAIRKDQCKVLDEGEQNSPEARAERLARMNACLD